MSSRQTTDPAVRSVVVTGNFDNWSQSSDPLLKKDDGRFEGVIQFKKKEKLTFKFVVNGSDWVINPDYSTEWDNGIENNVIDESDLTVVEPFEELPSAAAKIEPEVVPPVTEHIPVQHQEEHDDDDEDLLTSTHTDKDTELSQVSSYSAVSIPASTLEFVAVTPAVTEEAVILEDSIDIDDDGNATPIRSLSNSGIVSGAPATPTSPVDEDYDDGVEEVGNDSNSEVLPKSKESNTSGKSPSILNSINGNSHKNQSALKPVDILKAPGAFPSSPASLAGGDTATATASSTTTTGKASTKRDGFMGRFKSLFRY